MSQPDFDAAVDAYRTALKAFVISEGAGFVISEGAGFVKRCLAGGESL